MFTNDIFYSSVLQPGHLLFCTDFFYIIARARLFIVPMLFYEILPSPPISYILMTYRRHLTASLNNVFKNWGTDKKLDVN